MQRYHVEGTFWNEIGFSVLDRKYLAVQESDGIALTFEEQLSRSCQPMPNTR